MADSDKKIEALKPPGYDQLSAEQKKYFDMLATALMNQDESIHDIPATSGVDPASLDPTSAALVQALDQAIAGAKAGVVESEKLIAQAEQSHQDFEAWRQEHGITPELTQRFFAGLSPEAQQKVREEEEAFDREAQAELQAARDKNATAGEHVRRQRKFM